MFLLAPKLRTSHFLGAVNKFSGAIAKVSYQQP
jgi:hypothetical protein